MLLGCEIPEGRALKVPFTTVSPAPGAASSVEQVLAESTDTDTGRIDDVGSLGLEVGGTASPRPLRRRLPPARVLYVFVSRAVFRLAPWLPVDRWRLWFSETCQDLFLLACQPALAPSRPSEGGKHFRVE